MKDEKLLLSVALLTVMLENMDELEKNSYIYKHNLKNKGNQFKQALEKNIAELYQNMSESAQIGYFKAIKEVEEKIKNIDYATTIK